MSILSSDAATLAESIEEQKTSKERPIRGQKQVSIEYIKTIANLDDPHSLHTDPKVAGLAQEYRSSYKGALIQTTETFIHDAEATFVLDEVYGLAYAICNRSANTKKDSDIIAKTGSAVSRCDPSYWSYRLKKSKETGNSTLADEIASFRGYLRHEYIDWIHISAIREGKEYLARSFLCSFIIMLQFAVQFTVQADWLDAFVCVDSAPSKSPLSLSWTLARRDPQIGRMTADVALLVAMGCTIHKRMERTATSGKNLEMIFARKERKALSISLGTRVKRNCKRALVHVLRSPTTRRMQKDEATAKETEGVRARLAVKEATKKLKEQGERYAQCIEKRASLEERKFVFVSIQKLVLNIFANSQPTIDAFVGREPSVPKTLLRAVEELGEGYK